MTLFIRITSCVLALFAALAVFVAALFEQSGIESTFDSPIVWFGFSVCLFVVANYYGLLIRDQLIALHREQHRL